MKPVRKTLLFKAIFGLYISIFVFAVWGKAAEHPVVVALVAGHGNRGSTNNAKVLALAEAELSKASGLVIVERSQIDKIIQEQSLSSLSDVDHGLEIGRLLKADLYAIVEFDALPINSKSEKAPGGSALPVALVVFDVHTGRRYWDVPLPENTELAVQVIVDGVSRATEKSNMTSADLRTLCLLPIRNVGLTAKMDSFCENVGLILERRITRFPGMAVLERNRLEHILQERELHGPDEANGLLASMVRIEIELTRHPDGKGVVAFASLRDGADREIDKVKVEQPGSVDLDIVDHLLVALEKALLKTTSVIGHTREGEARDFANEAVLFCQQGHPGMGISAAQVAYALKPTRNYQEILLTCQLAHAVSLLYDENMVSYDQKIDLKKLNNALLVINNAEMTLRGICGTLTYANTELSLLKSKSGNNASFSRVEWENFRKLLGNLLSPLGQLNTRFSDRNKVSIRLKHHVDEEAVSLSSEITFAKNKCIDGLTLINTIEMRATNSVFARQRVEFGIQWLEGVSEPVGAEDKLIPMLFDLVFAGDWLENRMEDLELRKTQIRKMKTHPGQVVRFLGSIAEMRDKFLAGEDVQDAAIEAELRRIWTTVSINSPDIRAVNQSVIDTLWGLLWETKKLRPLQMQVEHKVNLKDEVGMSYAKPPNAANSPVPWKSVVHLAQEPTAEICLPPIMGGQFAYIVTKSLLPRPKVTWMSATVSSLRRGKPISGVPQKTDADIKTEWLKRLGGRIIEDTPGFFIIETKPGEQKILMMENAAASFPYCPPTRYDFTVAKVSLTDGSVVKVGVVSNTDDIIVSSVALGTNYFCLGSLNLGVYVFPLEAGSGPVSHLSVTNGLPSNKIGALAMMSNTLYIGIGEPIPSAVFPFNNVWVDNSSSMLAYDLDRRIWRLIASNARREKLSLLDNEVTFNIAWMYADSPRNRILFHVDADVGGADGIITQSGATGFWEYNVNSGLFAKRLNLCEVDPFGDKDIKINSDSYSAPNALQSFDRKPWCRIRPDSCQISLWPDGKINCAPRQIGAPWQREFKGRILLDGWQWFIKPFCRLSSEGDVQFFEGKDFGEILSLDVCKDGKQILLCSKQGLWLMKM